MQLRGCVNKNLAKLTQKNPFTSPPRPPHARPKSLTQKSWIKSSGRERFLPCFVIKSALAGHLALYGANARPDEVAPEREALC